MSKETKTEKYGVEEDKELASSGLSLAQTVEGYDSDSINRSHLENSIIIPNIDILLKKVVVKVGSQNKAY